MSEPPRTSLFVGFVVVSVLLGLTISSCKNSKQLQKNQSQNAAGDTSHVATDTSKGLFADEYDSLKSKVSGFLNSLLPQKEDTSKWHTVLTPPRSEIVNPVVDANGRSVPGFLNDPVKRTVEFDSNGNVIEHERLLGGDVRQPLHMTFDEYLRQQQDDAMSRAFRETLHKQQDTGKTVEPTTGILGDYGSIQIPIPPSIVPTIFGKPSISLRVNGDVAIHLAYRDNETYATSGVGFSGSETGLDFKQEINISTNGTIGDKLKIGADWGSDRMFQFDNLLKLGYTGFPDEILQSFEAGNVNFVTPSQYIGTQQALFGLKAITRFGPVYVTTLAAQKKGERQNRQFGGGAGGPATEHIIKPYEYRRNKFFLDRSFAKFYELYYATAPQPDASVAQKNEHIAEGTASVQVWVSTQNPNENKKRRAVAWDALPAATNGLYSDPALRDTSKSNPQDSVASAYFIKLDSTRFSVDPNTGVLTLNQEPSDEQIVAVSYVTSAGKQYGEQETSNPGGVLVLKLIKPRDLYKTPGYRSWANMLKNTYYVGGAGFSDKDFSTRIVLQRPDGKQTEYMGIYYTPDKKKQLRGIAALGLDRINNSNPTDKNPDGLVDYVQNSYIVDSRTGTITFPFLEPFGSHIRDLWASDKGPSHDSVYYLPEIYTQIQETLRRTELKQVTINVKYAGGVSSTLNLNAFNLVEGSVKVAINGTPLTENTDFRVDYNSGTVTLLRPDLVNTGTISVDYDVHDIFTNATKNVLGLRAEMPILDHGTIGTSLMNYSMHLPTLKTRQGEEPLSNWIWGFDGSYKVDAPLITDALNMLPFFNLRDKSEWTVRADAALSLPNPNTQKSPMAVDDGASIAYLDDFEGGKNQFPLYLSYGRWVPSSQPVDAEYQSRFLTSELRDSMVTRLKMRSYWYEPLNAVRIIDIRPKQGVARTSDPAQVLDVQYVPTEPGIYNPYPATENDTSRWAGMMQYSPGLNVAATNTDNIEMWIHVDPLPPGEENATLRFDMGRISEDIIPNKILNREDLNDNGKYDDGEDIGLDGLTDDSERVRYPNAWNPSDPNNDDYSYASNSQDFHQINGQQGNEQDAKSGFKPDNEDLDGNGSVNLENGYYEYEIPLNMARNKYVVGNTNNTWYQLRIPLAEFQRMVGTNDSSFSNIAYYRFWLKGISKPIHFQLNDVTLVGTQWTRALTGLNAQNPIRDTSLRISYLSIEENSGAPINYKEPPGAERARVASTTDYIQGNEQSLDMILTDVEDTGRREATRTFPTPNDIFNYRSMAIWVHGDPTLFPSQFNGPADTNGRAWVYFRFGTDQFNYYEYRRPLLGDWQNIHVDFARLTALKARRPPQDFRITEAANDGIPGSSYTVVGTPTLTNAPLFTLGVENKTHKPLTTDVWWDELRLLDANDKLDFAYNASTQLKLAEFGRITAGMVNERPDFHRVDERFNQGRALNLTWNITGEFNMEKMLPKWMEDKQSKLPLTVSHSESVLRPKFIVNTDVDLDNTIAALRSQIDAGQINADQGNSAISDLLLNNETLLVKNSLGASDIRLRFPGSFFLLPAFVNRLNFGFGFGESYLRSPQYEFNRSWSWTASVGYDLPPLPNLSFSPVSWLLNTTTLFVGPYSQWKINPLPSAVAFRLSTTRGRDHSLNRVSTLTLPSEGTYQDTLDVLRSRVQQINRVFTATRGMSINWKPFEGGFLSPGFEYALDVSSNMAPLETRAETNHPELSYDSVYYFQRDFNEILRDIFFKNGALARLGDDYNASQKIHMTTSPRLPALFGVEKVFRPVFDYRVEYRWQDAQTRLQNAKQAAWNNTITTGLELNVRELGTLIFGKPDDGGDNGGRRVPGRNDRSRVDTPPGVTPEEINQRGVEDRDSPPQPQREEARNQIERGERMRPQSSPNPLGRNTYITDSSRLGNVTGPRVDTAGKIHIKGVGTAGERDQEFVVDTVLTPVAPIQPGPPPVLVEETPPITLKQIVQAVIQKPLFDWNGTRFNFTQTNQSLNSALQGSGSGITNFLARGFFSPEEDGNGPSRAYQLGLITDPHGRLLFKWKPQFPFLGFEVRHGNRAPIPSGSSASDTMNVTDAFTQQNNFELTTSRPLWEGASINLNWKLAFGYDERNTIGIDALGFIHPRYITKTGEVSRTFLSIPDIPFLKVTQSGILRVGEKYAQKIEEEAQREGRPGINVSNARDSLSPEVHNRIERESFMEGFETLPFFSGFLREYLPRLNYSFNWAGLEKFPLFSFADRASVRHGYTGSYRRSFRQGAIDTLNLTALQTIVYAFRPLIALDVSWDKVWGGRLTTSFNYDTQTEWAADYSSTRITRRLSTTVGFTANFQRQGVSIPFLKLNLKNEFGASFTYSQTRSADSYYNFWSIGDEEGVSNGGLTKITIEPRVSYTVSQQLTLEGFYRYERTTPAPGALISPPTRLIQAGVDVRLKIQ